MKILEIAKLLEDQEVVGRKFADRVAAKFDGIKTTPNRLTMWRIVLSLPVCLCFTLASAYSNSFVYWLFWIASGSIMCTWALLLDFFDGSLARYQNRTYDIEELSEEKEYSLSFWDRLNLKGSSHFGTVLDPFSDKTLYFGAIFPLGWHIINPLYLWLSLLVALILTLIRLRAIRRALSFAGKGSANRFGKYKITIEVLAITSLVLIPSGPLQELIANIMIGTALIIGALSLTGHIWLGNKKAAALSKAVATRRPSSPHLRVVK